MRDTKKASDFVDSYGTFDTPTHKGGDSLHRVGMFWALIGMGGADKMAKYLAGPMPTFKDQIKLHKVHQGNYVRHPNKEWDASDFDRFSRDQMKPLIVALGYWDRAELKDLAIGHLKRGFLFMTNTRQNGANKHSHGTNGYDYSWRMPDITGPDVWALFIRAFRAWWLYPLLLVFDLYLVFTAIKWRWSPKHNIAMNSCLCIMYAKAALPTPWSWLATKIVSVPRLITLIGEHFHDFQDDMVFFADMFSDAWRSLRQ